QAVLARQHEVEQYEVGKSPTHGGYDLAAVRDALGVEAGGAQVVGEDGREPVLVLHDQHVRPRGIGAHCCSSIRGSRSAIVSPPSGVRCTSIVPASSLTRLRRLSRPSPFPELSPLLAPPQ